MKRKGKREVELMKEEFAESLCFVCKDGGDMRICDYKECLKSYHPDCVGKDDSFLGDSKSHWNCPWHTCSTCSKAAKNHCSTCEYSLCLRCTRTGDFVQVKGKNGLCLECLKLALLIEENKEYNSEGEKVDFTDRDTVEGLFRDYYVIINEDKGFELTDLNAAKDRLDMGKHIKSSSEDFGVDEEEELSDYDVMENEKKLRRSHKEKKSKKQKPEKRTPKSNKMKFNGWGSISLIEFLDSIGKSTCEKLSQVDVSSIVHGYIRENKLLDRKTVVCDDKLLSLFGKKKIKKFKVSELLEPHFFENQDELSVDEELECGSEIDNPGVLVKTKSEKKPRVTEEKTIKEDMDIDVPQSRFASVVNENLKLVYLNKSLLYELLKQPESFEEKVIGSFVRVKKDQYDYYARSSNQLIQVKGVKTVPIGDNEKEIVFLLSGIPKESPISLLSDDRFSEVECEDLRQKVQTGLLERPTIADLQQKAKLLHRDITQHWIRKELALLQKRIDQANEKGWRKELFQYLDQRKMLQTTEGQEKLLNNIPTVIPDLPEAESTSQDKKHKMEIDEGSPKSTLCDDKWHEKQKSEEDTHHDDLSSPEITSLDSLMKDHMEITSEDKIDEMEDSTVDVNEIFIDDNVNDHFHVMPETFEASKMEIWCATGPNGEREKISLSVMKSWSEFSTYASKFKVWKEDENEDKAMWLLDAIKLH